MRRLFLLVAAVVLVDTMFFAAVAPLLPHFSDELGLSKTAAGRAHGRLSRRGPSPAPFRAAGWPLAGASSRRCCSAWRLLGITSLVFAFANTIVLLDAARFVQGVGRRLHVGGGHGLAGLGGAARSGAAS